MKKKCFVAFAAALSLVACSNVGDSGNPPPSVPKFVPQNINQIVDVYYEGVSPKTQSEILNKLMVTINYSGYYDNNITLSDNKDITKNYNELSGDEKNLITVSIDPNTETFSENLQYITLTVTYDNTTIYEKDITNGNYKENQQGGNTIPAILKEIMETEYTTISGSISNTNITLTAQTIDKIFEIYPDLEKALANKDNATKYNEAKTSAKAKINLLDNNAKKALIAKVEEKLIITKGTKDINAYNTGPVYNYQCTSYDISSSLKVNLSGTFDIFTNYISSLSSDIDISGATFVITKKTSGGVDYSIYTEELKKIYDTLNLKEKNSDKLPTLAFKIYNASNNYEGLKNFLDIYEKYNESTKMQITGDFSSTPFDGSKLVDNSSNYTLFSSDNREKTSEASDIKSMDIKTLVNFSNKYNVKNIKNIIVSGTPSADSSVNWTNLTNVIFEGNMSNLKINNKMKLNGIVYFKDLPYNNSNIDDVKGAVRLKNLSNTISVSLEDGVLDLRDITKSDMNIYTKGNRYILQGGAYAVYFSEGFTDVSDAYPKIYDITTSAVINNEYIGGNIRTNPPYASGNNPGAKTARSLKEFEYYGNYGKYEKSAYSTYSSDTDIKNTGASDTGVTNLKNDINKKLIAKNNKNIDFINPDTNEIIFSILNDRQYNG